MQLQKLNPYLAPSSSVNTLSNATSARYGIFWGALFSLPPALFVAYLVFTTYARGRGEALPYVALLFVPAGLFVVIGWWWQIYGVKLRGLNFLGMSIFQAFALTVLVTAILFFMLTMSDGKFPKPTYSDLNPFLIGFSMFSIWTVLLAFTVRTVSRKYTANLENDSSTKG